MDGLRSRSSLIRLSKNFISETWILILYALFVFVFELVKPKIEVLPLQLFYVLYWLAIVIFLTIIYIYEKPHIELRSIISSALAGSFPSFAAFISMVLFVVFTSWLAEDLRNVTNPTGFINATLDVIYALGLLPAFALSIPEYKPKSSSSTKPEPKKVLISALSDPTSKAFPTPSKDVLPMLKSKFEEAYSKSNFEEAEKNY